MKKNIIMICILVVNNLCFATNINETIDKLGITNYQVEENKIDGEFIPVTSGQGIFYITKDQKYVIPGTIFKIEDGKPKNLSALLLKSELDKYKKSAISFIAKEEKYSIYVFFDITCHYCNMLYSQLKEYNNKGISVHLFAYPREGLTSQTAMQMETIFSSSNKHQLLDNVEINKISLETTPINIVKEHFKLGNIAEIKGTPAIISSKGNVYGGYIEPNSLINILENE